MPDMPTNNATLEARLEQLTNEFVRQVAREVRQAFAEQVSALVAGGEESGAIVPKKRGRPAGGTQLARSAISASAGSSPKAPRNVPPHCIAEGCLKAHGGPRNSFLCPEHQALPKKEKEAAKAAWRERKNAA